MLLRPLSRNKIRFNNFASKITQNNFKTVSGSKSPQHENSIELDDFSSPKVLQTMKRRLGENFTEKPWHQKNQYMKPCKWELTGWKYPFLHHDSPPSTRQHLRPREKKYKDISKEKLK